MHRSGFALFGTAVGTCAVAWGPGGIQHVSLPERDEATLAGRFADLGYRQAAPPRPVATAIGRMTRHLAGERANLDGIALDLGRTTPFARAVYDALRRVPAGETVTYGELARRAGSPSASRAVGRVMGKNPCPIVIPCHRVLAGGGKPGGFSAHGGTATKRALLAIEGVELAAPRTPNKSAGDPPYDVRAGRRHLANADPDLARLMGRVGPCRLRLKSPRPTFASLAEAIVYQQLSGKAAATIFGRLVQAIGELSPSHVVAADDATLRGAGLSRTKAAALCDLADKTLAGRVPSLRALERMDDEAIVERLTEVRGVGRWTVEMLLVFQLGRPDVLAADDYGLRKGFASWWQRELPTPKELMAHGERWRPFRSLASWYLWRATEL